MRALLRRAALLAALTLALGNSTCRARTNHDNDFGEDDGQETASMMVLPLPVLSVPYPVILPTTVDAVVDY